MKTGRLKAGDLDRRIAFKQPVTQEDGFGSPVNSGYVTICNVRAMVSYGRGSERREAGIEGNDLPATFRVRKSRAIAAVTTKDIIEFDDGIWDISSSVPFGDAGYDFTAIRRSK